MLPSTTSCPQKSWRWSGMEISWLEVMLIPAVVNQEGISAQ